MEEDWQEIFATGMVAGYNVGMKLVLWNNHGLNSRNGNPRRDRRTGRLSA
jgi:hypothetical protein